MNARKPFNRKRSPFLYGLVTLLSIGPINGYSQQSIRGHVIDSVSGKAVAHATIIARDRDGKIEGFVKTSVDGYFVFTRKEDANKEINIEVNHLGYGKQTVPAIGPDPLSIRLSPKTNVLAEVTVGSVPALRSRSDTLIYRVDAFADTLDRNIGEVLKRMPGFEVRESGQVRFNGQSISHFYIDGDDVLGNRYGLGTKSIKPGIVSEVEVYQNHQPIRALKDDVFSSDVALNLVIRDDVGNKWMGNGSGGVGLTRTSGTDSDVDGNYNLNVNLLSISPTFKTLNVIQSNDNGQEIRTSMDDLVTDVTLATAAYVLNSGYQDAGGGYGQFYNNRNFGMFNNLFFHLFDDWRLRGNFAVYIDKLGMQGQNISDYFTPDGNVRIEQAVNMSATPKELKSDFLITRNVDNRFTSIATELEWKKNVDLLTLTDGSLELENHLDQQTWGVKSVIQSIPKVEGRSLWQYNADITYRYRPEHLFIDASEELPVLLPEWRVRALSQAVRNKQFLLNTQVRWIPLSSSRFKANFQFAGTTTHDALYTATREDVSNQIIADDFESDLKHLKVTALLRSSLSYQQNRFRWQINVPLGFVTDVVYDLRDAPARGTRFLFQPYATMNYNFNQRHGFNLDLYRQQSQGGSASMMIHKILRNYQMLTQTEGKIPYSSTIHIAGQYNLQFIRQLLLSKIRYRYTHTTKNLLLSTQIGNGGMSYDHIHKNNTLQQHELALNLSKYMPMIGLSTKFDFSVRVQERYLLTNQAMSLIRPTYFRSVLQASGKIGKPVTWSHWTSFQWQTNRTPLQLQTFALASWSQRSALTYQPIQRWYLRIDGSMISNNYRDKLDVRTYANATVAYLPRKKILERIEVESRNLFGEATSAISYQGTNYRYVGEVRGRGRSILIRASFDIR